MIFSLPLGQKGHIGSETRTTHRQQWGIFDNMLTPDGLGVGYEVVCPLGANLRNRV
jgi:hypothetical protein